MSSESKWVGLSGPFTRTGPGSCERCMRETQVSWPWPFWRRMRGLWLGVIALLVAAAPLYLADAHGMLPAAMVLVFAIGPLNGLAAIRPTCLECGAVVERRAP